MRYFFHIAYQGTAYSGWQKHPETVTVQQVLETSISRILKTPVAIIGCGRTDAGVHASQFFFHMDTEKINEPELIFRLNKLLPASIAVFGITPVHEHAHARFDATERMYDYFIHQGKDPFLSGTSLLYPLKGLAIERMKEAVLLLTQYDDFRAFCTMPDKYEHTICKVTSASLWTNDSHDKLRFRISANRFLSKMIRIIVGKLLKVGTGKLSVEEFETYLFKRETPLTLDAVHPHGLYLSKVTYPYLDILSQSGPTGHLQNHAGGIWLPA